MKQKNKHVWNLLLAATILIVGCAVPSFAAPFIPTVGPGAVNTIVMLTAAAASTQTAAALPTSTKTPTVTPTASNTPTATPTSTATVIFILPTLTRPPSSSSGGSSSGGGSGSGSGGDSTENYACQVNSVSPANGATFGPRADFDAKWKVKNTGRKDWDNNSVDYAYVSGDKLHKVDIYDLGTTVDSGSTTEIIVDMQAPKNPGIYTTTWSLRTGSGNNFCTLRLTIVVQ